MHTSSNKRDRLFKSDWSHEERLSNKRYKNPIYIQSPESENVSDDLKHKEQTNS